MFELVISGGRVIDGAGNPWFRADLGIAEGRIAAVGNLAEAPRRRTLGAEGKTVAPGFIDIHSHSDFTLLVNPRGESKVRQGVTTELNGNCGGWSAPLYGAARDMAVHRIRRSGLEVEVDWTTTGEYLDRLERQGVGHNVATLVGHGTLRAGVVGMEDRPPTPGEMALMRERLEQALAEGAFGLSTGLPFTPGAYAATEEVVEISRVVARRGAFHATHLREEGNRPPGLLASIREAIEIGEKSGVPMHVSHLKAFGRPTWGSGGEMLRLMDEARARGVEVTGDQYPYPATQATLAGALIPRWAQEGGWEATRSRMGNPALRERLREEIETQMARQGSSAEDILIGMYTPDPSVVGLTLGELAARRGVSPGEAVMGLAAGGEAAIVRFAMSEEDIETLMRHPAVSFGTDGFGLADYGPLSQGRQHPRSFGTFARVLGSYVRERGVLWLEEAIRKMTSLPAQRLGLRDRGLLREGFWADVVVLDPSEVADVATYQEPYRYPAGIHAVLVNGVPVVEEGAHTGALPGRVLRFS